MSTARLHFPALLAAEHPADGPVRRTVPFIRAAGRAVPSLAVATALVAGGIRPETVTRAPGALVLGKEARKVALSGFAAAVHSQYGARRTHQQRPAGLHEG